MNPERTWLDLATLYRDTHARIGEATTRGEARKIVTGFVRVFDDPHFHVRNGDTRRRSSVSPDDPGMPLDTPTKKALDAMQFRGRNLNFRIDFDKLPGFERVVPSATNPFAWGTFTVRATIVANGCSANR